MRFPRTIEAGSPVSDGDVAAFERKYQITLPSLYRDFLVETNGGRSERDLFPIEGLRNNPFGRLHFFFGLNDTAEAYKLDWYRELYADRLEPNLLFIATTECADKLCLDLETGAVLYWDAYDEDDTGRRLYKIADSFEQFLNVLYRDELSPKMDQRT